MKRIRDFAGNPVPEPLELYQLTTEESVSGCHIYMEAQVFTPDSKRFLLHRSAHPHGNDPLDPEHRYLLCDLENRGELIPVTSECGVNAPSLSPDGKILYYFVDELETRHRILFKRRILETGECDELGAISEADAFPPAYYFYPLSTISSDGEHIAIATALRKKDSEEWPEHGLWVFDAATGAHKMVLHGKNFNNLHLQYCRNPQEPRTMLIQHNTGCRLLCKTDRSLKAVGLAHVAALDDEAGNRLRKIRASDDPNAQNTSFGLDLHVISDDGGNWRTLPIGRDGVEFCQGHQCWRGETTRVIASTLLYVTPEWAHQELIELEWINQERHFQNKQAALPGNRNILSRNCEVPHFLHFGTDRNGERIVSDYEAENGEWHLYAGTLGQSGEAAALKFVLNLGSRKSSRWHPHPFLSPDGNGIFFNSSQSGELQAYWLRNAF